LLLTERPRLLRQVRHHSERPEDADDALADACVQFLRHYTGPSGGEDALRWMLTVSKRCAWEITRRRRERGDLAPTVPFDESGEELGSGVGDTADSVERREEVDEVLAAIERLAPDERTVLLLFGLGFSYEEIARLRGWSYAKVHRRLSDGRARVRCLLEGGDSS
jgi:RNA polymerase sigma factor (sigma-70 family)